MRILRNDEMAQIFGSNNRESICKDFQDFILPVSTLPHFLSFVRQYYHNSKLPW